MPIFDALPELDLNAEDFQSGIERAVAAAAAYQKGQGLARSQRGIEVLAYDTVADTLRDPNLRVAIEARLNVIGITNQRARTAHLEAIFARDGADHGRARRACMPWFSKSGADRLRARARSFIDASLDDAETCPDDFDILELLTNKLPPYLYCEMIGAPLEDAPLIRHLSDENMLLSAPPLPGYAERIERAILDTQAYLHKAIEERRAHPGDDLLSYMIGLEGTSDVTLSDIIGVAFNALIGSTDTTSTQICLNLQSLAGNPDQWELLKHDPDLIPRAVTELVRYNPIVWSVNRSPTGPIQWNGLDLDENATIFLNIFAANNDSTVFPNPRVLDINRRQGAKGVLTFGTGPHACLGRMISVMEQEEVLRAAIERWDSFDIIGAQFGGAMFNITASEFRIRFKPKTLVPA